MESAENLHDLFSPPNRDKETESSLLNKPSRETGDPGNLKSRRRGPRPFFLNRSVYLPAIVITGQSILLIFGWTFFAVTRSRPIALPDRTAEWIQGHSQAVTMIATLIATVLSAISGFLYSRAIRYSISVFLTKEISLYTVAAAVKIADRSPIFNISRFQWTITAIICSIVVGAQTAAWSTLLTPKRIQWKTSMSGYELDMTSSDFIRILLNNSDKVNPDLLRNIIPIVDTSGSTSVSAFLELPNVLNFNQMSYANSTGGILPANYIPVDTVTKNTYYGYLPANTVVKDLSHFPYGFSIGYEMNQQGFTAEVDCQQRALDATTSPALELLSATDTVFNSNVTLAELRVSCSNESQPYLTSPILTSPSIDAVLGAACLSQPGDSTPEFDVIIMGWGAYNFMKTTVCRISPKITTLRVDYKDTSNLFNSSFPSLINASQPLITLDAPWIGQFTIGMLLRGIYIGQSLTGNSVGDTISTFSGSSSKPEEILEQYIRGVLEFSATLLRTVFTQTDNGLYPGNTSVIPESMRVSTNGTFKIDTFGWFQAPYAAPGVLIAPSFVGLVAIGIIVMTRFRAATQSQPEDNIYFDPGKVLHVIAAASAGGLSASFPEFEEDPVMNSQRVMVRLGPLENGRTGFIG